MYENSSTRILALLLINKENYGDLCSAMPALNSLPNQYKLPKEGTLNYMKGAYILVFIRNGAYLAHFFRQMPMKMK
jgi:hypothetical protein